MKKAFSMIELIIVIVILGVLAAIAIPRIIATRDDAEIVKAATNINILLSDLKTYYLTRDKLSKMKDMSSVIPPVKIKNDVCLRITAVVGTELIIEIKDDGLCSDVWAFSKFKELKDNIVANGGRLDLAPMSIKFQ
ncbi:prepilin-type N-terminal cleavage/methylation domain-containing protein [Campylobacter pinnipediorum]|uniref:prepilin-type N-terminal cleavage/methylation domain-containing protein n=1 Tax=Campylobacter pinnipediorum TaxID=1965231 RepID=UPI00084E06D3|nr:prepilin-type N-terminal cleavage/methylation domain-containing protein [Campylobacter pinnipediorum]OPA75969.1 hypothetical protein BFG05_05375 [Campylobacter pinnipediorum subsp. pinnipediorum]